MEAAQHGPKRNHHVLPRLFLKGFSAEGLWIWRFDRFSQIYAPGKNEGKHNPVKMSLRSAGMIRDFYAYERRDGTVEFEEFEKELEKMEKKADAIWPLLCNGLVPSGENKIAFAEYIAHMLRRVPAHFEAVQAIWEQKRPEYLSKNNIARLVAGARAMGNVEPNLEQQVEDILAKWGSTIPRKAQLGTMGIGPLVPRALSLMGWRLLEAPIGCHFVTSDAPVFFDKARGLKFPAGELLFPISSRFALLASWLGGTGHVYVTAVFVREVNRAIITNAKRWVFACSDSVEYHRLATSSF